MRKSITVPLPIRREQNKILTQRIIFACMILFCLLLVLIARLFFLQVLNEQRYKLLSDKNRIYTSFSVAPRGNILDRHGQILATSQFEYQAILDLRQYRNETRNWELIQNNLKLDKNTSFFDWLYLKSSTLTPSQTLILKEALTWKELVQTEILSSQIFGLYAAKKIVRVYPYSNDFCHLIGYVTAPKQTDINHNANLKAFGSTIGRNGIERAFETQLQGKLGIRQSEINAMRRIVRVLEEKLPENGQDIQLTIDAKLQHRVIDIMQLVRSGAAIVMDIPSGDILAMVSCPTFDPNQFTKPIQPDQWKAIITNPDHPLIDRSIAGLYAPGSTFKMIIALAALNAKIINEETTFYCPGYYEVNGHRFHCWKWRTGGHGSMNVISAIEQSCDVFFYNLASKLKPNTMIETARSFGFGTPTGIEIHHEKNGLIPPISFGWKKQNLGIAINLSIGQGQILTTPLQLVRMAAMIAGKKNVIPHLIPHDNNFFDSLPYAASDLNLIQKGMIAVVNGAKGTAQLAKNPVISIAGKTGSTQVYKITKEERLKGKLEERPYDLKDHALFVGFAPVDTPKFAIVVIVEHGESGGRTAAPLARDILIAAQKLTQADSAK